MILKQGTPYNWLVPSGTNQSSHVLILPQPLFFFGSKMTIVHPQPLRTSQDYFVFQEGFPSPLDDDYKLFNENFDHDDAIPLNHLDAYSYTADSTVRSFKKSLFSRSTSSNLPLATAIITGCTFSIMISTRLACQTLHLSSGCLIPVFSTTKWREIQKWLPT